MLRSEPTPTTVQELARTSDELQQHVNGLTADSQLLDDITRYDDPGEGIQMMTALGSAIIRFVGDEDVTGHKDGPYFTGLLLSHFQNMGASLANRQRVQAGQIFDV
jgi:hypothetical protein